MRSPNEWVISFLHDRSWYHLHGGAFYLKVSILSVCFHCFSLERLNYGLEGIFFFLTPLVDVLANEVPCFQTQFSFISFSFSLWLIETNMSSCGCFPRCVSVQNLWRNYSYKETECRPPRRSSIVRLQKGCYIAALVTLLTGYVYINKF